MVREKSLYVQEDISTRMNTACRRGPRVYLVFVLLVRLVVVGLLDVVLRRRRGGHAVRLLARPERRPLVVLVLVGLGQLAPVGAGLVALRPVGLALRPPDSDTTRGNSSIDSRQNYFH